LVRARETWNCPVSKRLRRHPPPPTSLLPRFTLVTLFYPAGTGSAWVPSRPRRSSGPNSGRARWLSASRSQEYLAGLTSLPPVLTSR